MEQNKSNRQPPGDGCHACGRGIMVPVAMKPRNYYPKGGMCLSCSCRDRDCSALSFHNMPVIATSGKASFVKCTHYSNRYKLLDQASKKNPCSANYTRNLRMYKKVRGHQSWWLQKDGKSIGHFNIDGLISDEEAEKHVDEIIANEQSLKQAIHALKMKNQQIKEMQSAYEKLENECLLRSREPEQTEEPELVCCDECDGSGEGDYGESCPECFGLGGVQG